MSDRSLFEARRYSAVVLADVRFATVKAVTSALKVPGARTHKVVAPKGWDVRRIEIVSARRFFPSNVEVPIVGNDEFLLPLYLAHTIIGTQVRVIVASPYVELLKRVFRQLSGAVDEAPLVYLKPQMGPLFEFFEENFDAVLSANRISVRMTGESGLDVVSLTGDNPLRSGLRHQVLKVSRPYGIRLKSEVDTSIRPTNVHLDTHGNLFWHHAREEAALANVLTTMSRVMTSTKFVSTLDLPLMKVVEDPNND